MLDSLWHKGITSGLRLIIIRLTRGYYGSTCSQSRISGSRVWNTFAASDESHAYEMLPIVDRPLIEYAVQRL